jgi:hypothetical protein
MLCSYVHPKLQNDQWYNMGSEESDPRFMQYKIELTQTEAEEWRGVLHIVQGWIQQKQLEK